MIPYELLRSIILADIPDGLTVEEISDKTKYPVTVIKRSIRESTNYTFEDYAEAKGVCGTTLTPYYSVILPVDMNRSLAESVIEELNSYGLVIPNAKLEITHKGYVSINGSTLSSIVFYTYNPVNNKGCLLVATTGYYESTEDDKLHELYHYFSIPVPDDSNDYGHRQSLSIGDIERINNSFNVIFSTRKNINS